MKKWISPKFTKLGRLQKVTAGGGTSKFEGSCSAGSKKQKKPGCP